MLFFEGRWRGNFLLDVEEELKTVIERDLQEEHELAMRFLEEDEISDDMVLDTSEVSSSINVGKEAAMRTLKRRDEATHRVFVKRQKMKSKWVYAQYSKIERVQGKKLFFSVPLDTSARMIKDSVPNVKYFYGVH